MNIGRVAGDRGVGGTRAPLVVPHLLDALVLCILCHSILLLLRPHLVQHLCARGVGSTCTAVSASGGGIPCVGGGGGGGGPGWLAGWLAGRGPLPSRRSARCPGTPACRTTVTTTRRSLPATAAAASPWAWGAAGSCRSPCRRPTSSHGGPEHGIPHGRAPSDAARRPWRRAPRGPRSSS